MRKLFLIASAVFLVLFGSLQLFIYMNRPVSSDELRVRAAMLPPLRLTALDGKPVDLADKLPVVLIYFNTTCDHCQRQVEALRRERGMFTGIPVVLMSSQPEADVREFVEQNDFVEPGFMIVRVQHEEVAERFGVLAMPQIFVYDADRKLVELFSGETSPEKIRQTLP
jgi:peroxiredoxin